MIEDDLLRQYYSGNKLHRFSRQEHSNFTTSGRPHDHNDNNKADGDVCEGADDRINNNNDDNSASSNDYERYPKSIFLIW